MTMKLETPAQIDFSEELSEWIEAFDDVVAADWENGTELLNTLRQRARDAGVPTAIELTTPYRNSIPKHDEVPYPGDRTLERRVEALIRWNAM
ncbi:MAG TPA: pyruvate dehydrogenase (acetyl-transferring), homodimeric type, partial [Granulicella sp.]